MPIIYTLKLAKVKEKRGTFGRDSNDWYHVLDQWWRHTDHNLSKRLPLPETMFSLTT